MIASSSLLYLHVSRGKMSHRLHHGKIVIIFLTSLLKGTSGEQPPLMIAEGNFVISDIELDGMAAPTDVDSMAHPPSSEASIVAIAPGYQVECLLLSSWCGSDFESISGRPSERNCADTDEVKVIFYHGSIHRNGDPARSCADRIPEHWIQVLDHSHHTFCNLWHTFTNGNQRGLHSKTSQSSSGIPSSSALSRRSVKSKKE